MSAQVEANINAETPRQGVASALIASSAPKRTVFSQFSLVGRVAMVTGGHRGIGVGA